MTSLEAPRSRYRATAMSAVLLCLTMLAGCASAPVEETPPPPTSLAGLPAIASYEFELVEPGKPTEAEQREATETWHEAYDSGLATLDSYGSVALMNPDGTSFRIIRPGNNMKFCSSVAVSLVEVVSTDSMRITYESMSKVPVSCLAIGSTHADDLDIPPEVTQRPVYLELINSGDAAFVLTIRE